MRFRRTSAVVTAFAFLLLSSSLLHAAPDFSLSGRLIFEDRSFSCELQCRVTLLALGVRPVETVFPDFANNFSFRAVPRGTYTIRVDLDGFESRTFPLQESDETFGITITVPLIRKPAASSTNDDIVNVSEFLQQYPKPAVSSFEKGSELRKKNHDGEAIKYFENAVKLAPTFYEAHNQLGVAYRDVGRKDDAEREFIKAHELNSTGVEPLLSLTALYLDENDPQRAVTAGEQAVKTNSHSASAFFGLGVALYNAAQLDRAEGALKRALDLAPKMATVHLALANVYLKLRRYDSTLEQLDSYIAENPRGQQIHEVIAMRDRLLAAGEEKRP